MPSADDWTRRLLAGYSTTVPRRAFIADPVACEVHWSSDMGPVREDLAVDRQRSFAWAADTIAPSAGTSRGRLVMWDLQWPGIEVPLLTTDFDVLGDYTSAFRLDVSDGGAVYIVGNSEGHGYLARYAGAIRGLVTDGFSGLPVQDVEVHLFDEAGAFVASTTTGASGAYHCRTRPQLDRRFRPAQYFMVSTTPAPTIRSATSMNSMAIFRAPALAP